MMMHTEVTIGMVNRTIEQIYREADDEALDYDELEMLCLCWKIKEDMAKIQHMKEKPGARMPALASQMAVQGVGNV